MILAVTGHRPHKLGGEIAMNGPVSNAVRAVLRGILSERRPEGVVSGMALGVDMIWAEEALELEISVTAAIPFKGQESLWPYEARARYAEILDHPLVTKVVCSPGGPSNHKYDHRNRWMVDHSDELVAVWDGSSGGTRNCVLYASEVEKPITYVRPTSVARTEWRVEQ